MSESSSGNSNPLEGLIKTLEECPRERINSEISKFISGGPELHRKIKRTEWVDFFCALYNARTTSLLEPRLFPDLAALCNDTGQDSWLVGYFCTHAFQQKTEMLEPRSLEKVRAITDIPLESDPERRLRGYEINYEVSFHACDNLVAAQASLRAAPLAHSLGEMGNVYFHLSHLLKIVSSYPFIVRNSPATAEGIFEMARRNFSAKGVRYPFKRLQKICDRLAVAAQPLCQLAQSQ